MGIEWITSLTTDCIISRTRKSEGHLARRSYIVHEHHDSGHAAVACIPTYELSDMVLLRDGNADRNGLVHIQLIAVHE